MKTVLSGRQIIKSGLAEGNKDVKRPQHGVDDPNFGISHKKEDLSS